MDNGYTLCAGKSTVIGGNRVKIMADKYGVSTVSIGVHVFTGEEINELVNLITKSANE